ncbi:hypothetical protein N7499_001780 [Penicillium canescens]|nr:hypothetical protein N7522_013628 [Penicillium canescens]KAJ6097406.1 hypothetical protein N7499_001780 [Penicillium canescens]KAJ6165395.1 hypothetical protein N7485_008639 [Penicillium canescens]
MLEHSSKLEFTQYEIAGGNWNSEYQIRTDNSTIYHVQNLTSTPDKPELTFYAGTNTNGPVVGTGKFIRFSSDVKINLGDPSHPDKTTCTTTLSKKGFLSTRHTFQMDLHGEKRTFTWKNTESHESFGPTGSHKMVDEQNQVLAVLSPGGGRVQKDGYVNVYAFWGESFDLMVLVTALVLREKTRREKGESSYIAGGGGLATSTF